MEGCRYCRLLFCACLIVLAGCIKYILVCHRDSKKLLVDVTVIQFPVKNRIFSHLPPSLSHSQDTVELHQHNATSSATLTTQYASLQCSPYIENHFDCWPESSNPNKQDCVNRGCCWSEAALHENVSSPACYFPENYDGYKMDHLNRVEKDGKLYGYNATLRRRSSSPYPGDVRELRLLVFFETATRVRFKIFDPHIKRYEVPMGVSPMWNMSSEAAEYDVSFVPSCPSFGINIFRKNNSQPLFDSRGMAPLIFANQFLQIGTVLSSPFLYGLGEHRSPFLLDTSNWQKLVFWNRDQFPKENLNLYGSHPFYLNLEPDGNAHGVFLLNSNAMQVNLQPSSSADGGALTFITTGGILDFFIFTGPTPDDVVRQYISVIGKPFMPPFWALGFHLCKHGYRNSSNFNKVIQRNRAARMPYDVQWNDLDYSSGNRDWTWNNKTYVGLPQIIADLHAHGQRNVIIVDPGISSTHKPGTYAPFDKGLALGVFLKTADSRPLIGKLWPGQTAFVDFLHPSAPDYWEHFVTQFHSVLPFDGLWIDMNEPSNFVDGSLTGCTNNSLDKPPFTPPGIDGGSLYSRTTCPSAQQNLSSHYNLHNLYGWSETRVTARALWKLLKKRSLVISRSTFPGSGHYGGHWTGDNLSSFKDLYYSIPEILNFNLFGIPLVGADVCGFRGNTTRELCIRWMQLGAFYPFMRNHAEYDTVPQDPAVFDSEAQNIMRAALELRYSLLPYMYTQFYIAHTTGAPVIRPLFFDFRGTESIDKQFLWGKELLVSPVLTEGAVSVSAYIPKGTWYDIQNLTLLHIPGGAYRKLDAPLDKINVHVHGGSILPMLPPAVTTTLSRKGRLELLAAPDFSSGSAYADGKLFWDDGESLDTVQHGNYTEVHFVLNTNHINSFVLAGGYYPATLWKVRVLNIASSPKSVILNGKQWSFQYDDSKKVLNIEGMKWDLRVPFKISWT